MYSVYTEYIQNALLFRVNATQLIPNTGRNKLYHGVHSAVLQTKILLHTH